MRVKKSILPFVLLGLLSSCYEGGLIGHIHREKVRIIEREVRVAIRECESERKSGKLHSYLESIKCSNPKIYSIYQKSGFPYPDLLDLYTTAREVGAERLDKGTISQAQFDFQSAILWSRIETERENRENSKQEANASSMQGGGFLLMGLSAFAQ